MKKYSRPGSGPTRSKGEEGHPLKRLSLYFSMMALIISVPMAMVGAWIELRGSEVEIVAPKQILFYTTVRNKKEFVAVAVPLTLINRSPHASDVMIDADIRVTRDGPRFKLDTSVVPIQAGSQAAADGCGGLVRCLQVGSLTVVEQPEGLVEVPAGSPQFQYLTFLLVGRSECIELDIRCKEYKNFTQALARVAHRPIELDLRLKFHSDGERQISCSGERQLDANYFIANKWSTIRCRNSKVEGAPIL